MPRLVILGCGTGVGKTRVSVALLRELKQRGLHSLGLKPIESGVDPALQKPAPGSDAADLTAAGSLRFTLDHPLYALRDPVSPHLAARALDVTINVKHVADWVENAEIAMTSLVASHSAFWSVIETAGGVFSPLASNATNFDLAQALEPAVWVLVAADALGVLHDVSATLQAMRARGRSPEHVLLSAAREPDASTGRNAVELASLGIAEVSAALARHDDHGISALVDHLLTNEAKRAGTR